MIDYLNVPIGREGRQSSVTLINSNSSSSSDISSQSIFLAPPPIDGGSPDASPNAGGGVGGGGRRLSMSRWGIAPQIPMHPYLSPSWHGASVGYPQPVSAVSVRRRSSSPNPAFSAAAVGGYDEADYDMQHYPVPATIVSAASRSRAAGPSPDRAGYTSNRIGGSGARRDGGRVRPTMSPLPLGGGSQGQGLVHPRPLSAARTSAQLQTSPMATSTIVDANAGRGPARLFSPVMTTDAGDF